MSGEPNGLGSDAQALERLYSILSPRGVDQLRSDAQTYAVLPGRDKPRYLLPADAPREACAAMRASGSGNLAGRIARASLGPILVARLPKLLGREVLIRGGPDDDPSLLQWLEQRLGMGEMRMTVAVGPPRPNRKPVLQLFSRTSGATIAFAKLGVNDLTDELVRCEAGFVGNQRLTKVSAPKLIMKGEWRDHILAVFSPLPRDSKRGAGRLDLTVETLNDIARQLPVVTCKVSDSRWLRGLEERSRNPDRSRADRFGRGIGRLGDRLGDTTWRFGAWHGDLTPWNAQWVAGRLHAWDWERAGGPVPVGFDAIHAGFQVAYLREGASLFLAAERACAQYEEVLVGLQVPRAEHHVLADCYKAELCGRLLASGPAGPIGRLNDLVEEILEDLNRAE